MEVQEVGIREFKEHMAEYLRRVKRGEPLVLTERGKPVCRLVPERAEVEARMKELVDAGLLYWSGRKLRPPGERVPLSGFKTVSEIVLENRE